MTAEREYPDPQTVQGVTVDHRHVSPEEAQAAADIKVGGGAPDTAPDELPKQTVFERLTGRFKYEEKEDG